MTKIDSSSSGSSGNGIGLGTLATLVFVVLKLTGVIDWSWWMVLAPVWIPLAAATVIMGAVLGLAFVLGKPPRGGKR